MNRTWTREDTMIAFNLYCKLPFRDSTRDSKLVEEYAEILKRTPGSLILKIGDLGRLDCELKKYSNTADTYGVKLDREIWNEFLHNPMQFVFDSEKLIARITGSSIKDVAGVDDENLPKGCYRKDTLRRKIGFSFFRKVVLSSYNNTCCVSGVRNPLLVEACHITEWDDDENKIVNPRNGLCLNYFMHKAYDRKLMSVSPDYKIHISERMKMSAMREDFRTYLTSIDNRHILLPDRFSPSREMLSIHYEEFKKRE